MLVDCHCHLGGSIPPSFILNAKQHGLTIEEIEERIKCKKPYDFQTFLSKFKILDTINWTEELIDDSIKIVCDNIKRDNIDHVLMDFSIDKYMNIKWNDAQAIKFIRDSFDRHSNNLVSLILSIKYESTYERQEQLCKLIDSEISNSLLGIDLVGDESKYNYQVHKKLLRPWIDNGKLVRAHVGESGPADNIKTAIKEIKVTNVAHGIKCINDNEIIDMAIDNNIYFDVAITSNYMTGVWKDTKFHPIVKMYDVGMNVTP